MKLPPRALLLEYGINLLAPWVVYKLTAPRLGEMGGLVASGVPPLLWALGGLLRNRRLDALSGLVLLGIVMSVVASLLGGDPRLLLMRESLVSGSIGLAFLVSLAFGRPLVFYLGRATVARESAQEAARFEQLWDNNAGFVRAIRLITAMWGAGLCGEFLLRAWMVTHWPIDRVLIVSPTLGYIVYGGLAAWTVWYRARMAMRAKAAAKTPY